MKTEFQKMRTEERYSFADPEIVASIAHAIDLCRQLQTMTLTDEHYRDVIEELVPGIPSSSAICPPFHCDHGHGIVMGEHTFLNYNCTILDGAYVRIGHHVLIGPNCQLYTPQHPMNYLERRLPQEVSHPISIGDDTWLGGGVIVCLGAHIGRRCIIGAGSVVVHDIPDDCLAVGNPAVIKKRLR